MKTILVTLHIDDSQKQKLLNAAGGSADLLFLPSREVTDELLAQTDAVIGNLPPKRLSGLVNLKWVQLGSAGVDGYTTPGVFPEGAVLTNASGAYGLAISEHMIACLLFLMKNLCGYAENQKEHLWRDCGPVSSVWNSQTLVVGLGDIGG